MFCKLSETLELLADEADITPELKRLVKPSGPDGDDGVPTILVPSVVTICSTCNGEGKHSLHLGAFSGDRLDEARADTDFWDDYTSGRLDKVCDTCDGQGRVRVPDTERLPKALKALITAQDEDDAMGEAERRAERRAMGDWD